MSIDITDPAWIASIVLAEDARELAEKALQAKQTPGPEGPAGPQGEKGERGPAGTPGARGATGPKGNDGKAIVWRGEWEADRSYGVNDAVQFHGNSFVATADSVGVEPSLDETQPWDLMVARGASGLNGAPGVDGRDGVDGAPGTGGSADLDSIVVDTDSGELVFDLSNGTVVWGQA